jgi:hypothetical protein
MSPRARMEYLDTIYLRYKKASVKENDLPPENRSRG